MQAQLPVYRYQGDRPTLNSSSSMLPSCLKSYVARLAFKTSTGRAASNTAAAAGALPPFLTLERSTQPGEADLPLRSTQAFSAEVFPDLPVATTWQGLWRSITRPGSHQSVDNTAVSGEADTQTDVLKIITIGANLRSSEDIERHMRAAASPPAGAAGRAADGFLLVSGSHPLRSIPGVASLHSNSLAMLRMASKLRKQGHLPVSMQLWAVANPNVEPHASLAEQKVDQGAQVLITQPPFDMDSFQLWWEDAQERGVLERARVIVGHPMISSASNLAFWMALSSCSSKPVCSQLLQRFRSAEADSKEAGRLYCDQYNKDLTQKVMSWGNVGGFHVMPITPRSKQAAIAGVQPGGMLHQLARKTAATP